MQNGDYELWAYVTDEKGAKSNPSEKISINVSGSTIIRIGTWATNFLAVVVPFVALIFILLFIVWYGQHKLSLLKQRIRKEVRKEESELYHAFNLLKENIQKQIKILERARSKRQLTKEEEKIIKQFKKIK